MPGIDRRRALQLFGAVGAVGAAAACGSDTSTGEAIDPVYDDPVRIGLLIPGGGGFKLIGDDIRDGFRTYLAGTDGRLGGHPVTELSEDEGDDPDDVVAGLERLIEQGAQAVLGMTSPAALAGAASVAEEAHVPLLSAHASPQEFQGSPYVWRTSHVHQEPGLALGRYLAGVVNGPVAVLAQDDPLGRDTVDGLREGFAGAGASDLLLDPVFTPESREPNGSFFADALATLAGPPEPEAVVAAYVGAAATAFVEQYVSAGHDPGQLLGPAYLTEGEVLAELAEAALGIRTAGNYSAELRGTTNRSFTVSYRAEFGAPSMYSVAGYDAAAVLDTAIRLIDGDAGARQINLALGEVGLIDSPRGRWQFNQNRTPTQKWYLREVAPDGPVLTNMVIRELGTLG